VLGSVLIAVLQAPSLAWAQDESSESTAGSDREVDGDPEGRPGDDGESAGGRSSDIQEVIQVEGARAAGLKEVPISVTQFGASDIQNLRIQNVADLSAYTPNLEINTAFAASNPTLFIRGVGLKDYNSNSTGAVAIWQDGIMMNSPAAQLFSLYDIESIEVLRGPVGGVGGRNASAGQIRINSFKPNGEWTSDGSFTYGNLNLIELTGALGLPIFPETFNDTLSARFSFATEIRDGYTNNTCSNWDPEEFGYLESSEDKTLDFYDSLDPFDRGPEVNPNQRFIYRNLEAVELYNSSPEQSPINLIEVDGETVGRQGNFFRISPDRVCLVDNPGRVVTGSGASGGNRQEGTFLAQNNVRLLSDYQGLQKTYNDVKYYAMRGQLLWEPTERLSFLANFHWGENSGDAFHVQPVGASPRPVNTEEQVTEPPGYFESGNSDAFSEVSTELDPFEARVKREGLHADLTGDDPGFAGADIFNGFYSTDGKENLELGGFILDGTYEPDWGRIVYVGGYEFNSRDIVDEGGGSPSTTLEQVIDDETWQYSNDLRVLGGFHRLDWTFSFFQLHEELDSRNLFPSSIKFATDQKYTQDTDAYNVGADLHYDFLEDGTYRWLYQISFDGGFRYNWAFKEFSL
jgi:outer membrane receptor protein involved in Fe transport